MPERKAKTKKRNMFRRGIAIRPMKAKRSAGKRRGKGKSW